MLLGADCFKMFVIIGCYKNCSILFRLIFTAKKTGFQHRLLLTLDLSFGPSRGAPELHAALLPFPLNIETLLARPRISPLLTQTTFPGWEMLMVAVSGVSLDPCVCSLPFFPGSVRKDFHLELVLDMAGWAQHAEDERDSSQVGTRVT